MKKAIVLTDSTSDLSREVREKYEIEYVQMQYILDGVEYPASLDWENHTSKEFYDLMRKGKHITTSQVLVSAYKDLFEKYTNEGNDVIYIGCSSALSGSVNLAKKIVSELKLENRVFVVDSLCSSLGQGHMAITAAKMLADGATAEEVYNHIEETKLNINQFGTVASLDYLKRAGRVKAESAFFGNIFGIKPIIISDIVGQNYAIEKVKGAINAKKRMAELIEKVTEGYDRKTLYISHADALEDAEKFRDIILERVKFEQVHIGTIGPIVGSCVGPGTIISFCYGEKVTVEGK